MQHARLKIAALLIMLSVVFAVGCTSNDFEQKTYTSLATSRAVILEAKHQADIGNIPRTPENVTLINDAQRIHNDAVTAFRSYIEAEIVFNSAKANEAAASALGKTQAVNETAVAQISLQSKMHDVTAALSDVAKVVTDVSALVTKKK